MNADKLKTILEGRASAFTDAQLTQLATHLGSEQALEDVSEEELRELFPLPLGHFVKLRHAIVGWQQMTRHKKTGLPAGHSATEVLSSALPRVTIDVEGGGSASGGMVRHPCRPAVVERWTRVDPADDQSPPLMQAIVMHQRDASATYLNAEGTQVRLLPMPEKLHNGLVNEAEYATTFIAHVGERLATLAKCTHPESKARWQQQPPCQVLQEAWAYEQQPPAVAHPPPHPHPYIANSGSVSKPPEDRDLPTSPAPAASGTRIEVDVVMLVDEHRPAREGQAATVRQKCVLVGEVNTAEHLMWDDGAATAVDLVAAWNDPDHPRHTVAQAVVAQLFTHMQAWQLCHGFTTCWLANCLAYCPADDRTKLYLSDVILATQHSTAAAPSATVLGGLAWIQDRALRPANQSAVQPYPCWAAAAAAADGNARGGSGDGAGGRDARGGGDGSSGGGGPDDGASSGSQDPWTPTGARSNGGISQERAAAPHMLLTFHEKVCHGSAGLVMRGDYLGRPAVIKLLGPDEEGVTAFETERAVYSALRGQQGLAMPRLLGTGDLPAGVCYLALERIGGVPLSDLAPIPSAVAEAALRALTRLHTAQPGFVHGDIRLQNVMLVCSAAGTDATTQACKIIDFGRSRLNGSTAQQRSEKRELKQLLGLARQ